MKLTYNNKTIDFFEPQPEKILLSISGGLDSAVLFYLTSKYLPEMYVVPVIGVDHYARWDAMCANENIQFIKERFPNANVGETREYHFNHEDPYWMDKATKEFEYHTVKTIPGLSKALQMRHNIIKIRQETGIDVLVSGTTANPPREEMQRLHFDHLAEPHRDVDVKKSVWTPGPYGSHYTPFANVDKRFIASIYKEEGLLEDLYPYTSSCVGMPWETDFGQHECGQCFWCYEKKWGFEGLV
jgi:hypothetical protein